MSTTPAPDVIATRNDDPAQYDPFLLCTGCGEKLCEIEEGDTFAVLASVVADHVCTPAMTAAQVEATYVAEDYLREIGANVVTEGDDPEAAAALYQRIHGPEPKPTTEEN